MSEEPESWRRRPAWWRNWKFGLLVLVLLPLAALYSIRAARLARIAGTPEPFDLAAASQVEIDPEKNAFRLYRMASLALGPTGTDGTRKPEENIEALKLFLAGSELTEALYNQPGMLTSTTLLDVVQNLRDLARLALAEARRLEEAGDPAAAWGWHRATLRASRHTASHGPVIQYLVGSAIHAMASEGVTDWAANPANDAAALRRALGDTREAFGLSRPVSEAFQVEYLFMSKALADPLAGVPPGGTPIPPAFRAVSGFISGEPAMSQAVLRRAFANYLSQCDKPRHERTAIVPGTGMFFERDPKDPPRPYEISPETLEQALQDAPLARLSLPALSRVIEVHDREQAREALLELGLILQIHYREHGTFPESAAELLGPDLKRIPIDPFGKGEPVRYRREPDPAEGVTIWSIGQDGVDDGGRSEARPNSSPPDVVIRVKPPVAKTQPEPEP